MDRATFLASLRAAGAAKSTCGRPRGTTRSGPFIAAQVFLAIARMEFVRNGKRLGDHTAACKEVAKQNRMTYGAVRKNAARNPRAAQLLVSQQRAAWEFERSLIEIESQRTQFALSIMDNETRLRALIEEAEARMHYFPSEVKRWLEMHPIKLVLEMHRSASIQGTFARHRQSPPPNRALPRRLAQAQPSSHHFSCPQWLIDASSPKI